VGASRQPVDLRKDARRHWWARPVRPETIRQCAAEAENRMLEENRDWFLVMKFRDFELHV
jgi:hypothetical protein